jgi:glycosyltransferase involved in cell wall biosynthesis
MLAYAPYEHDSRVRQYAEALAARGDEVDVVSLRIAGQTAEETLKGVRVHRIQSRVYNEKGPFSYLAKTVRFLLRSAIYTARRHFRAAYDLIHVHSVPDFEVLAALLPRLRGAKVILDIHDIVPEFYASKFNKSRRSVTFRSLLLMERICTALADHVLVANDIWRERLASRAVKPEKCTTILNYADPIIFRRRPRRRDDGKFIVIFPGTLNWHQGVDIAIRAFKIIKNQAPNAEFHIYGDGQEKDSLRKLASELGLEQRVIFHRLVPLDQIADVIADADVGVVPKRARAFGNEAFSTKIMEFMTLGVPAVVASTEIDRRYFNDSVVRFFESENVADLAQALLELRNDAELRARLVKNASAFVAQHNWSSAKTEYFSLVDRLVHNGAGRS